MPGPADLRLGSGHPERQPKGEAGPQAPPADFAAFEALFASHGPRMKSLALNMLGNRSDAEDAVQDAFLRAYRSRQTFRSDAALWTWVYRILLNACYDIGRRRATRSGEESLDADPSFDVPSPRKDHPLRIALQRALDDLSPIYREVFLLCEVEGHTHREVAQILDIPEGTSKGRLFEARRQLKERLRGVVVDTKVSS
jgi:RNA polymerase sigma-70 factor (ECF subfamily)